MSNSNKDNPAQESVVLDERYSLKTYDGLLLATEDLFNRYLIPSDNQIELDQVKGASVLLREARGILDSQRRAKPKAPSGAQEERAFSLNAAGPFSVFQGGK